ncbi:hypothetical protein [Paracoccus sp. MKU1]|uniref:DUF7940 domain-containing protein n=1 Tax=Paracoccus sp. MKU1 TaxID=1745182 RepID=UPI0007192F48|nr:hypothetical protein [Paracoccus sp. MKU1]KRW94256.1 hypothetical protein AQY21_20205 [Paracoccus sp. MKU1]
MKTLKLIPNWRYVLTRAWSVRFAVLAALLSSVDWLHGTLDASLPILQAVLPSEYEGTLRFLITLCIVASAVSRLLAQIGITHAEPEKE